jgi:hypothetical protein
MRTCSIYARDILAIANGRVSHLPQVTEGTHRKGMTRQTILAPWHPIQPPMAMHERREYKSRTFQNKGGAREWIIKRLERYARNA